MKITRFAVAFLLAVSLCGCNITGRERTRDTEEIIESISTTKETEDTSSVSESAVEDEKSCYMLDDPDIRNLKWGMTVEEVIAHEPEELSGRKVEKSYSDQMQTLLTYDDVEFRGYKTQMILCVVDEIGLDGVNYHIADDDYYKVLMGELTKEYGEPTYNDTDKEYSISSSCSWVMPDKGLYIFILKYTGHTQLSYFCPNSLTEQADEINDSPELSQNVKQLEDPDIRNLKWGMTVEEVIAHEPEELSGRKVEKGYSDQMQTLLRYDDVEFRGYKTQMILCFVDGIGLNGVNYHIPDEDYYKVLMGELTEEYGEPTYNNTDAGYSISSSCSWDMPDKGLNIFILKYTGHTQFSFFPLLPDETSEITSLCPVVVELTDMPIIEKDPENDILSDYALFYFEILNYSDKNIKGITGLAVFYDLSGNEILKVDCEFFDNVAAESKFIDDTLALELVESNEDQMALKYTPYKDIKCEFIVSEIEYDDGTTVTY